MTNDAQIPLVRASDSEILSCCVKRKRAKGDERKKHDRLSPEIQSKELNYKLKTTVSDQQNN